MAQVGSGTSGKVLTAKGTGSSPKFEDIGTDSGLTNNGVVISKGTDAFVATATLTNGQIVIGSTAGVPAAASLTASAGISISGGSNSISIAVTGGGFGWQVVAGTSQTVFSRMGYIARNNSTRIEFTMNAVNTGDASKIVGQGSAGWRLNPTATQRIYLGNSVTKATTGYIESTNSGDCVELIAISATEIVVINSIGNLTIT